MKRVHVVAAVIARGDEILIARRPDHVHQGGKWEFPGGKLEAGESAVDGLRREIHEELGILVRAERPLIRVSHDYPDKQVLLDVWWVDAFDGEPEGREGQQVRWVKRDALREYEFPAANVPIVAAVQLPAEYVISPNAESMERFLAELDATVARGLRLIQIRVFDIAPAEWARLAIHLRLLRELHGVMFLLNSASLRSCLSAGAPLPDVFAGIHLTSADLMAMECRPDGCRWLAASCHSPEEITRAEMLGVDFVTLSPVQPTQSHPSALPLGWAVFAEWVERARLPVYGLGGLQADDVARAQAAGAQGVAGISGFWQTISR